MLFNSFAFLVFMPLVFVAYQALHRSLRVQNLLLLAVSYLFYGWWDVRFLSLIVLTTLTTWATAIAASRSHRRLFTTANIVVNLGILFYFKYADFFALNLSRLFGAFGIELDWVTLDILLPVGISFYTFQAIGYSIDVARGNRPPEKNLITFATFVAFFPQLVAGPIERSNALLPQLAAPRRWDYPRAVAGMRELLWGLFKKVAVADPCGAVADRCFDGLAHQSMAGWTAAAFFFTAQIYFDFSGYSNMARGTARLLGVQLMVNFRNPYFANSVPDFWRRWHISLMEWFKDYVYIPLGGSRRGKATTFRNIALVFVLSGIWHGAAWNFIMWGCYWALLSVVWRVCVGPNAGSGGQGAPRRRMDAATFATLVAVVVGWIIFRSPTLAVALTATAKALPGICVAVAALMIGARIAGRHGRIALGIAGAAATATVVAACIDLRVVPAALKALPMVLALVACVAEYRGGNASFGLERMPRRRAARLCIYWLLLLLILTAPASDAQFIYFQF